jgi:hypothetical protein
MDAHSTVQGRGFLPLVRTLFRVGRRSRDPLSPICEVPRIPSCLHVISSSWLEPRHHCLFGPAVRQCNNSLATGPGFLLQSKTIFSSSTPSVANVRGTLLTRASNTPSQRPCNWRYCVTNVSYLMLIQSISIPCYVLRICNWTDNMTSAAKGDELAGLCAKRVNLD